jgi:hypothetical protein
VNHQPPAYILNNAIELNAIVQESVQFRYRRQSPNKSSHEDKPAQGPRLRQTDQVAQDRYAPQTVAHQERCGTDVTNSAFTTSPHSPGSAGIPSGIAATETGTPAAAISAFSQGNQWLSGEAP